MTGKLPTMVMRSRFPVLWEGQDREGIFRVVGHLLHDTLWMFSRKWDADSTGRSGNGDKEMVLFSMRVL
jgi:hypothetical protein